jgi:hypothetical protein
MSSRHTIKLKTGILDRLRQIHNIPTDQMMAAMIDVDRGTLRRIAKGDTPSAAFIAGTMCAFDLSFDALFEVVDERSRVRRSAEPVSV